MGKKKVLDPQRAICPQVGFTEMEEKDEATAEVSVEADQSIKVSVNQ